MSWNELERNVQRSPLVTGKADKAIRYRKKKANGGTRLITDPGPRTRAAHHQISHILTASGLSNPYEFNAAGAGRERAVLELRDAIASGVYSFVVFDLENHYSSVRPQHLKQLRLPSKVTSTVFMQSVSLTIWKGKKPKSAPHGLPQGAPASSKIASALLGRIIRHIGGNAAKVTYVDDGVIGASGPDEAEQVAKALKKGLADLSGGPMRLKFLNVCDVRNGMNFLGYWIRASQVDGKIAVTFSPNHAARKKLERNVHKKLRKKKNQLGSLSYDQAIDVLATYREAWLSAYSLWHMTEYERATFYGTTETWVDDFLSLKM